MLKPTFSGFGESMLLSTRHLQRTFPVYTPSLLVLLNCFSPIGTILIGCCTLFIPIVWHLSCTGCILSQKHRLPSSRVCKGYDANFFFNHPYLIIIAVLVAILYGVYLWASHFFGIWTISVQVPVASVFIFAICIHLFPLSSGALISSMDSYPNQASFSFLVAV